MVAEAVDALGKEVLEILLERAGDEAAPEAVRKAFGELTNEFGANAFKKLAIKLGGEGGEEAGKEAVKLLAKDFGAEGLQNALKGTLGSSMRATIKRGLGAAVGKAGDAAKVVLKNPGTSLKWTGGVAVVGSGIYVGAPLVSGLRDVSEKAGDTMHQTAHVDDNANMAPFAGQTDSQDTTKSRFSKQQTDELHVASGAQTADEFAAMVAKADDPQHKTSFEDLKTKLAAAAARNKMNPFEKLMDDFNHHSFGIGSVIGTLLLGGAGAWLGGGATATGLILGGVMAVVGMFTGTMLSPADQPSTNTSGNNTQQNDTATAPDQAVPLVVVAPKTPKIDPNAKPPGANPLITVPAPQQR